MEKAQTKPLSDRTQVVAAALNEASIDLLVCTLPINVLLTTGYWPIVGPSISLVSKEGEVLLVVPEDEGEPAQRSWANRVITVATGSLEELTTVDEAVRQPLWKAISELDIGRGKVVAIESRPVSVPSSYVAGYFNNLWLFDLLKELAPFSAIVSSSELTQRLRAVLTPTELTHVRLACAIAAHAFEVGRNDIRAGLSETEIAALFRLLLTSMGARYQEVERVDGHTFCMSGPNSFEAYASYQQSRTRQLQAGDLVLIHCNSYADGYWTDITRTFCLGEPDERQSEMFKAILMARAAALEEIKPGVKGSAVDKAARTVLKQHGFEKEFRHGLGHGVGFAAIDHGAPPRLHPASADILEPGMVFNIEPAIYIEGLGGIRHCDMVAVTEKGAELLTPFQSDVKDLVLGSNLTGKTIATGKDLG